MSFLTVPADVIEDSLMPHLEWNDWLRLRRTCSALKDIADKCMRKHGQRLAPEMEIDVEQPDKNFGSFLELGVPTSKMWLSNARTGYLFFEKDLENMATFLEEYGPLVKHLRMSQISLHLCGKEWDFLEALVNLESLKADVWDGVGWSVLRREELWQQLLDEREEVVKKDARYQTEILPKVFKQLKTVDIGQHQEVASVNIVQRTMEVFKMNKVLEYIRLPFNPYFIPTAQEWPQNVFSTPATVFQVTVHEIAEYIRERKAEDLPCFDFDNYHNSEFNVQQEAEAGAAPFFVDLCAACVENNVKLKNVSALLVESLAFLQNRTELLSPIVSIVNVRPFVFTFDLPNLERIDVRKTSRSIAAEFPGRVEWPTLKQLEICVDSRLDSEGTLFQLFFRDISRESLVELRLDFSNHVGRAVVPRCDDIVASCPNLKKLTLVNWPGTNKELVKLWAGLAGLEEICLESCKKLGNVAFVGEDVKNPVVFKLNKLRKLTLKGLDQMPKITDTLFSLVLRDLPLTHLVLTSDGPIKTITSAALQSLVEGRLADSIQKFPFRDWSLDSVSPEEFQKLERQFRSYDMI